MNGGSVIDLSIVESFIPNIAAWFNIEPATALLFWAFFIMLCNGISRMIPDTETGWLGVVRNITRVIGVHIPNRVARRTTAAAIAEDAIIGQVERHVPPQVKDYFDSVAKKREDEVDAG